MSASTLNHQQTALEKWVIHMLSSSDYSLVQNECTCWRFQIINSCVKPRQKFGVIKNYAQVGNRRIQIFWHRKMIFPSHLVSWSSNLLVKSLPQISFSQRHLGHKFFGGVDHERPCWKSVDACKVETPIHDSIRELVTWECKELGVKSWMCSQIQKEVLGVGIWIFGGLSNFTHFFKERVL
jgi:hypothetical protein